MKNKSIYTVHVEKWTEYNDKVETLLLGKFDSKQLLNVGFNWATEYFINLIQLGIENADYYLLDNKLIVGQDNNNIIILRYHSNNVNGSVLYNTNEIYIDKCVDWM